MLEDFSVDDIARHCQHRHHHAAAASAAGVKSGERSGEEKREKGLKKPQTLVSTLVMLLFRSGFFGGHGGHSEVWRDGHFGMRGGTGVLSPWCSVRVQNHKNGKELVQSLVGLL